MGLLASKRRADGSFEPSRLYYWVKPDISGNEINGLGETRVRRPKPVYHYVKIKHPWRLWQNIFYFRTFITRGYFQQFVRAALLNLRPPRNIATGKKPEPPAQLTETLKKFLLTNGAGDVAVARMRPEWVIEGMEVTERFVVTFAVPQDFETVRSLMGAGIDVNANAHMMSKYNAGTQLAKKGADLLRERGHHAYGYCGPASGRFTSIPAALAGGLGELGKHGSIINAKMGSNFRIGYILTDAELVPGKPVNFGADDFCVNCQVCTKACPPKAIYPEKQMVRGVHKWYVDFDKCISYFNEAYGCGICIVACPWSRPGVADKLIVKMARKSGPTPQISA